MFPTETINWEQVSEMTVIQDIIADNLEMS